MWRKIVSRLQQTFTKDDDMSEHEYLCELDLTEAEIAAGKESGQLELWREDADGNQWYRAARQPVIYGVGDDTPWSPKPMGPS